MIAQEQNKAPSPSELGLVVGDKPPTPTELGLVSKDKVPSPIELGLSQPDSKSIGFKAELNKEVPQGFRAKARLGKVDKFGLPTFDTGIDMSKVGLQGSLEEIDKAVKLAPIFPDTEIGYVPNVKIEDSVKKKNETKKQIDEINSNFQFNVAVLPQEERDALKGELEQTAMREDVKKGLIRALDSQNTPYISPDDLRKAVDLPESAQSDNLLEDWKVGSEKMMRSGITGVAAQVSALGSIAVQNPLRAYELMTKDNVDRILGDLDNAYLGTNVHVEDKKNLLRRWAGYDQSLSGEIVQGLPSISMMLVEAGLTKKFVGNFGSKEVIGLTRPTNIFIKGLQSLGKASRDAVSFGLSQAIGRGATSNQEFSSNMEMSYAYHYGGAAWNNVFNKMFGEYLLKNPGMTTQMANAFFKTAGGAVTFAGVSTGLSGDWTTRKFIRELPMGAMFSILGNYGLFDRKGFAKDMADVAVQREYIKERDRAVFESAVEKSLTDPKAFDLLAESLEFTKKGDIKKLAEANIDPEADFPAKDISEAMKAGRVVDENAPVKISEEAQKKSEEIVKAQKEKTGGQDVTGKQSGSEWVLSANEGTPNVGGRFYKAREGKAGFEDVAKAIEDINARNITFDTHDAYRYGEEISKNPVEINKMVDLHEKYLDQARELQKIATDETLDKATRESANNIAAGVSTRIQLVKEALEKAVGHVDKNNNKPSGFKSSESVKSEVDAYITKLNEAGDARKTVEDTIHRDADESVVDGIKELPGNIKKLYYSAIDGLAPLRKLSADLEKKRHVDPSGLPIMRAMSLLGVDGKSKQFLENSPFELKGEDIILRKDIKPLFDIIKPIIKSDLLHKYEGYLTAKANIELIGNGLEKAATTDLRTAQEAVSLYEKEFGRNNLESFSDDTQLYQDAVLRYYRDSGMLSGAQYDAMKDLHQYYVPFKRFFDDFENSGQFNISKNITESVPSPVKRIKGSERDITSPIGSMIKNTYDLLAAADKNYATRSIVDALKELYPESVKKVGAQLPGKFAVSYWDNGVKQMYEVPKEYYDSIFTINEPLSKVIKMLSLPSRILQAGAIVYDPTFGVRNISRDQVTAIFLSKYGYNPLEFVGGLFAAVNKKDIYQKFLASGADQSFLTAMDKTLSKSYIEERSGKRIETKWQAYKNNPLELLQDIGRASEAGTRVGAFKKALEQSGNIYEAMKEGREITADYGVKGSAMANINPLWPFFNARLQHLRLSASTLKNHPMRTLARGITTVMAPTIMNWMANNMDEERRRLYQNLPAWRRYTMWNIPILGTDSFLPVPKGFFGQLFGTSTEGVLDWVQNEDPRAIRDIAVQLFGELTPINGVVELSPQFARPLIEQWANKKAFTGGPIVPGRLEKLDAGEQSTESTTQFVSEIGKALNISPLRIEALITGYTGGTGKNVLNITDEALQLAGIVDKKPDDVFTKISRLPIAKALITPSPYGFRSRQIQDFYSKLDEMESINSTVGDMVAANKDESLVKFLNGDRKKDYLFYLQNQKEINAFKSIIGMSKELKSNIMKSDDYDRMEKITEIDKSLTSIASDFLDAYNSDSRFNIDGSVKHSVLGVKKSRQSDKKKIDRFKKQLTKEAP